MEKQRRFYEFIALNKRRIHESVKTDATLLFILRRILITSSCISDYSISAACDKIAAEKITLMATISGRATDLRAAEKVNARLEKRLQNMCTDKINTSVSSFLLRITLYFILFFSFFNNFS